MRKSAIVVVIGMCLLVPTIASADSVLYTLSTDYSGIDGLPAGSTVSWQFEVPSILTTPTTIPNFKSTSLGPGLSSCGVVLDAQLPFPAPSPFTSEVITEFTGSCFGITSVDTFFNGDLSSAGFVHTARDSAGQIIGTLAISSVPEPMTMSLLTTGLIGMFAAGLRRRAQQNRAGFQKSV